MKKTTLALTLSTIITLSSNAQALELLVVQNYNDAGSAEIWKKAKPDQVPGSLLSQVSVSGPQASYSGLFPKTFMQESLFAVCHRNCNDKDIFKVKNGEIDDRDKTDWNVIEQSTVYYWLNRYFSFLDEKIHFQREKFLRVMTNRELRDETKGKVLKNNAFFSPSDFSLSFLPASKSILFKLMGGKINRSGFDPSVITHEASHYVFQHLFANPVNDEIGGLNEGFADYMAHIFLNSPKVGLVMMQGQSIRDSSVQKDKDGNVKSYQPGMEVHDLGERVSMALWKSRELSNNKEEMDRMVLDAVKDLSSDPYASVHHFKLKMLERLSYVTDPANMEIVKLLWETTFPGNPNKIESTAFLDLEQNDRPIMGFKTKQVLPENLARDMGIPAVTQENFSILQLEKISPSQIAIRMGTETDSKTTPYWIALDAERANILGIYGADKELITEENEIEEVRFLATQAKGVAALINDFQSKVKEFADLSQGKGTFGIAYKVKEKSLSPETIVFNGTALSGSKLRINLKRKLLAGLLLGLPEIEIIDLYLLPIDSKELPELEGQRVVGYKIQFKTGTSSEVILDKLALQ